MKYMLLLSVLLAGCASLAPTSINPGITYVTNDVKAIVAASAGNCTIPIAAPSTGVDCAALDPATATVDQNKTTMELCFSDAAGTRISAAANALRASLCAGQAPPPVVTAPAKRP